MSFISDLFACTCFPDTLLFVAAVPLGADPRLGDGGGGRGGVLPRAERHHVHHQRGRRQPLHAPPGGHHSAQRAGHQEPGGDPVREGVHQPPHAGRRG